MHTNDPRDPRLSHGVDDEPVAQADVYLVADSPTSFVRPVRRSYRHQLPCGAVTTMSLPIAETYARQPSFYGATYCTRCQMHRPVGEHGEFTWMDPDSGRDTGIKVGT